MTVTVRPANEVSWDDLRAVFGTRGDPANCQCQWFKARDVWAIPKPERADRLLTAGAEPAPPRGQPAPAGAADRRRAEPDR
ncbi:hypothetical protein AB0H87_41110, partial [Asanoa sp. NPDC050611]